MVSNADEVLERHLAENPEAEREWRNTMKLRSDPRVNMLGRVLRKSSIDEIPQLVNVLRGEMSCVGPRPIIAEELPRYDTHLPEYLQARPGMTGVWQISGRNTLDYAQRVALDCEYIRNWSIWRDLVILGKTIFVLAKFHESS
jgi:exopolysaccharide production protein ExoY